MRLDGLDPSSRYLVKRLNLPGEGPHEPGDTRDDPGVVVTIVPGSVLIGPGLEAPVLPPEAAALFHLTMETSAFPLT